MQPTQSNVVVISKVNVIALACINTMCFFLWLTLDILQELEGWREGAEFLLRRDRVELHQTVWCPACKDGVSQPYGSVYVMFSMLMHRIYNK